MAFLKAIHRRDAEALRKREARKAILFSAKPLRLCGSKLFSRLKRLSSHARI
jgi:hypothetical protein